MKTIKLNSDLLICILIMFGIINQGCNQSLFDTSKTAQTKKEKNETKISSLIEGKKYVFMAETAIPMSGRTVHLTSNYEVFVNKDSLVSYLPYYGVAYSAPYNSSKSPLDFSSTDFNYSSQPGKKGGYNIAIEFKDQTDIRSINLSISSSGYGTLSVNSNNRQSISFYGYVSAKEDKK